jgi:deoxyribodipyrimidine photo-lyase
VKGVSYLSAHNRFGTISIRELARTARAGAGPGPATWLSELVWRDFYFQILWHHPHAASGAFRREYDAIDWPGTDDHFAAWCEARTGFPIVDAAMRQINATGYMHNRLRMIVASFLVKDLLVDWRRGERYFAGRLVDFDLAANNGGWQWAASTGCDAQPYFRIFNPVSQSQRFDPGGRFIRRYLPELAHVPETFVHAPWTMPPLEQQACGCVIGRDYPAPVVDHAVQRERALGLFKAARGPAGS